MTGAFAQLVELFLADMGATWAGVLQEPVMKEGRRLGNEAVQIACEQMPVHTSDLKVRGSEIQKLIEKENRFTNCGNSRQEKPEGKTQTVKTLSTGDAMKYLLARVQSGSIPNEREALLQALERKLKKNQKTETEQDG